MLLNSSPANPMISSRSRATARLAPSGPTSVLTLLIDATDSGNDGRWGGGAGAPGGGADGSGTSVAAATFSVGWNGGGAVNPVAVGAGPGKVLGSIEATAAAEIAGHPAGGAPLRDW